MCTLCTLALCRRVCRLHITPGMCQISNLAFEDIEAMVTYFRSNPFPVAQDVIDEAPLCLTNSVPR